MAITHTASSGDFTITETGTYTISYSVIGTNTTTTGVVSVQLRDDGTEIPGSTKSGTIATANDTTSLAATVMITADGSETITLNMIGTGFSFTNASMLIIKED